MDNELVLQMEDNASIDLVIGDEDSLDLSIGESVIVVSAKDYNMLENKPSINGVTLEGDKTMTELFTNILIIDGGTAPEVSP